MHRYRVTVTIIISYAALTTTLPLGLGLTKHGNFVWFQYFADIKEKKPKKILGTGDEFEFESYFSHSHESNKSRALSSDIRKRLISPVFTLHFCNQYLLK